MMFSYGLDDDDAYRLAEALAVNTTLVTLEFALSVLEWIGPNATNPAYAGTT